MAFVSKIGDEVLRSMGGGAVVPEKSPTEVSHNTKAAQEVDELLRTVCSFSEDGTNACQKCPYRKEFFNFEPT